MGVKGSDPLARYAGALPEGEPCVATPRKEEELDEEGLGYSKPLPSGEVSATPTERVNER